MSLALVHPQTDGEMSEAAAGIAALLGVDGRAVAASLGKKGVLQDLYRLIGNATGNVTPASSVAVSDEDAPASAPAPAPAPASAPAARPVNLCQTEPEDVTRFVLTRGLHPRLDDMRDRMMQALWFPTEIHPHKDLSDFTRLTADEQHFVSHVLAFFAASDGIVNENIAEHLQREIILPEAKAIYGTQFFVETIHSEVYRSLIDAYYPDPDKRKELLNAIMTLDAVKAKADLVLRYANDDTLTLEERLVVFMFVEGILFSAAFCAVFWLKKRGLMPQLCLANYLISRDEGLHVEFAQILLKHYVDPANLPSVDRVYEILDTFIATEDLFVSLSLPVELIGMNSTDMKQHVRYVADGVLEGVGYPVRYGVANPFDWMDTIVAELQTNFYENKVGEYNLDAAVGDTDDEFGSDDDDY